MNFRPLLLLPLLLVTLAADIPTGAGGGVDTAGKPQARLALGQSAPEIAATDLDGKSIALAFFNSTPAKPIILQFASLTDPIFRTHTSAVERLAQRYADKATFIILYQRESHPADTDQALQLNADDGITLSQPIAQTDRITAARQMIERLNIKHQKVLVDVWANTTSLRYGSYPNMTFLIDAKGILQAAYPWMDSPRLQGALEALLAGRPIPLEYQGSIKLSSSAPLDFTGAALDMTGGRNAAASIANVIDKFNLTDQQKSVLYPALAEYLASLQNFRANASALPGRAARAGAGAATRPALPPNAAKAATQPTPADAQRANQTLRAAADKLKNIIKQNLPAKDATTLLQALESSQAQRLFADQ